MIPEEETNTSFIDRVAINKTESLVQVNVSVNTGTFSTQRNQRPEFSSGSGKQRFRDDDDRNGGRHQRRLGRAANTCRTPTSPEPPTCR